MSNYNMSRKFKKLTLQYSFLKLEKEEVEEICDKQKAELHKYLKENHPEYYEDKTPKKENKEPTDTERTDTERTDTEPSDAEKINKEENKNKDLKTLYRKIATKTHPDKVGDDKLSNIFNSAARAYEQNNIAKLLELAGLLNIELFELSEESIILLEKNIKSISSEINTLKENIAWAWYNAKTDEDKEKIIKIIIDSRR